MKEALYTQTFVATGLRVCGDFESYKTGIYDGINRDVEACDDGYLHSLLAYGYDDDDNDKNNHHWLVKNSWGTTWGEKGLGKIRMVADKTPELDNDKNPKKDGDGNVIMERVDATPLGLQDADLLTIKWDGENQPQQTSDWTRESVTDCPGVLLAPTKKAVVLLAEAGENETKLDIPMHADLKSCLYLSTTSATNGEVYYRNHDKSNDMVVANYITFTQDPEKIFGSEAATGDKKTFTVAPFGPAVGGPTNSFIDSHQIRIDLMHLG